MGPETTPLRHPVPGTHGWLVALDVGAKVLLVLAVTKVALDPAWGNLEGKAPGTRAVTYPMLAFLLPFAYLWRPGRPFPWAADLLITLPAFSDVLGNRYDLYDRVVWFDDVTHLVSTGAFSAACVMLLGAAHAPLRRRLEVAVASGMTLALLWELWEYVAFVTRSSEASTAYADTVGDLALGWVGAVGAALLLGLVRPRPAPLGPPVRTSRSRSGVASWWG